MKKKILIGASVIVLAVIAFTGFKMWSNRILPYESAKATFDNLNTALVGETTATEKYIQFAEIAKNEGYKNLEKLFLVTADAEKIHIEKEYEIANSMKKMDKPTAGEINIHTSAENLQSCIDGEIYESTTMYPDFVTTSENEKFNKAQTIFKFARDAEASHAVLFKEALDEINSNNVTEQEVYYYLCPVCGKVEKSNSPFLCSVCGTPGMMFAKY